MHAAYSQCVRNLSYHRQAPLCIANTAHRRSLENVCFQGEWEMEPSLESFLFFFEELGREERGGGGGEDKNFSSFQYFLIGFRQNSFILLQIFSPLWAGDFSLWERFASEEKMTE